MEEVVERLAGGGFEASSSSESDKVKSTATTFRFVPDVEAASRESYNVQTNMAHIAESRPKSAMQTDLRTDRPRNEEAEDG